MRLLFAIASLLFAGAAAAQQPLATRILVDKSDHKMYVYSNDRIIATFPVGLGVHSRGPKQQEGDRRTPEGKYVLDYKNPASSFFRSIHISYPNPEDRASARRRGVKPGGDIMIHGQPNNPELARRVREYPYPDWTDGCIALSNVDMLQLWDMVRVPTPIEIVP